MLSITSCNENIYKKPITITKIITVNKAGPEYQERFDTINAWYLQLLDSVQIANKGIVIDTSRDNKVGPLSYYIEATLDEKTAKDETNKPAYSIYIHPSEEKTEKLRSMNEYDYLFGELRVVSDNDSVFFNTQPFLFRYLSGIGMASKLLPSDKLYEPIVSSSVALRTFSVDTLEFSLGFNRSQKFFFKNIVNNAFVLRQAGYPSYSMLEKNSFAFYSNFISKSRRVSGEYTVNFNVIDSEATDEIYIKMNYYGGKDLNILVPEKLTNTIVINRQDFFAGNHYEANLKISRLVSDFIAMQYFFDK